MDDSIQFNDELPFVVGLAIYVNDTVLALLGARHSLRWQIVDVSNFVALLQRQQGVEQTHHQIGVLSEYLLESQVGFWV